MSVEGAESVAELQRAMAEFTALTVSGAATVVVDQTFLLAADVRREASQPRTNPRPRGPQPEGPRRLTGGYGDTIQPHIDIGPVQATGTVGTNDIRGPRLEFGPREGGLDYPHFGPAHDRREPIFVAEIAAVPVIAAQKTRGGKVRSIVARLFGRG